MKIKVVKSISQIHFGQSLGSIESLVGNSYNVMEQLPNEGLTIYIPEWKGLCSVYKGEYEIIED